ncbi:1,2-dihydroxy-3-keto-5-methylthiopentene dioxygenase [Synechococcus elongatus]|uniref:Acireductone dioxygenase n=1 Tax=Synechococcus elongatus PCC 11802 TaxID=2283154 RepID=A0AAT9JX57_SYNEL|nr:cupin [Synechococcus elongatus]QFZ93208.1 cupin [Synechococcus elongatus PCC 11802]
MTVLTIYREDLPKQPLTHTTDAAEIAALLAQQGLRFERWPAQAELADDATPEQILTAYAPEIDRVKTEGGYITVDAISLRPDHPDRAALRQKFLAEHIHSEDEVRFFVAGQGLFSLHLGDRVYALLCTQNDWISVPAGTRHWFDMGSQPYFTALRFFNNPEGWVAQFTGSEIASQFPLLP